MRPHCQWCAHYLLAAIWIRRKAASSHCRCVASQLHYAMCSSSCYGSWQTGCGGWHQQSMTWEPLGLAVLCIACNGRRRWRLGNCPTITTRLTADSPFSCVFASEWEPPINCAFAYNRPTIRRASEVLWMLWSMSMSWFDESFCSRLRKLTSYCSTRFLPQISVWMINVPRWSPCNKLKTSTTILSVKKMSIWNVNENRAVKSSFLNTLAKTSHVDTFVIGRVLSVYVKIQSDGPVYCRQ